MNDSPRRPAQLADEQIEYLTGEPDPAYSAELAHASASSLIPVDGVFSVDDDVRQRVLELAKTEGIDVLAESWVRSPADSLPGILWRGYLLREWLRREPTDVANRFAAAREANGPVDGVVPAPGEVKDGWMEVFGGSYGGNFSRLLAESAALAEFLATVEPVWIADESHELATQVTLRADALKETAEEFKAGARAFTQGKLT